LISDISLTALYNYHNIVTIQMIVTTKKEQNKGKRGILLNTPRFSFAKYDLNNGGSLNGSSYGTTVGGAQ
jgi:hypothetical protein